MKAMRYGLILGSSKNMIGSNSEIIDDIVNVNVENIVNTFKYRLGNVYNFGWQKKGNYVSTSSDMKKFTNTRLINRINEVDAKNDDDIFLLYYFGHGYSNIRNQLCIGFDNFNSTDASKFELQNVYDLIYNVKNFKKIIIILDCCYAGLAIKNLKYDKDNTVIMTSCDMNYMQFKKYGGIFSQALCDVLDDPNIEKYADKQTEEISYLNWFMAAKRITLSNINKTISCQEPQIAGAMMNSPLLSVDFDEVKSKSFDSDASKNSIYHRLFILLSKVIGNNYKTTKEIFDEIVKDNNNKFGGFKINDVDAPAKEQDFIHVSRIEEYLRIGRELKFCQQNEKEKWYITEEGLNAVKNEGAVFNEKLIYRTFDWIAGYKLSKNERKELRKEIKNLLVDLIKRFQLPNIDNIDKKLTLEENSAKYKISVLKEGLRLLSYTEIIQRCDSQTYFP